MMFPVKLSIFGFILYSLRYPDNANESGTSWNHTTEQNDTVGVRISRLLTVELDMQAPPPNNTLLRSPGKGHDKKLASGQKPGKSGKPTSKVGEEGSLPQSPQNKAKTEKKDRKHGGNAVKTATDKQTPEQNKPPVNPSGVPVKTTAQDGKSGKPEAKVGSEGILVASEKTAQITETSEQTRGLCSTLARTICRNKWWIPATLAVFGFYIVLLYVASRYDNAQYILPSVLGVTGSIGLMLVIMLIRFYYRRGKAKVPKKALKDKITSEGEQKRAVPKKPNVPKKPEVSEKPEAPKTPEAPEKPETHKKPETPENQHAPKQDGESETPQAL
ncbi:hypothetical protein AK88_05451 [Plasmodium fragile]|uniref:Uncharacterized protein n=1 Tax=Plasmodium fragile TaxID=5857 RepID=A0A0D9QD26_PLAFR|nr:uncharacterized protein AK88_05451 [Plasmodium fragile]KJP84918.1 hypothetical protein AK88_05451 [Plasmodium fragile]